MLLKPAYMLTLPVAHLNFALILNFELFSESLLNYFSQFGEVVDCVVMKNPQTGKSRGFGFVTYKDPSCVTTVLSHEQHILDGRQVLNSEKVDIEKKSIAVVGSVK